MFLSTVKIAHFTLRKSNLASQRIFCTLQPYAQNQQATPFPFYHTLKRIN
ncbi:hypothetical protein PPHE_a0902 [Pseudoalteromonas phenolica O-BC30]|nr:hypothetical protein [Pseudoalteromonas phenolica O-BC30]